LEKTRQRIVHAVRRILLNPVDNLFQGRKPAASVGKDGNMRNSDPLAAPGGSAGDVEHNTMSRRRFVGTTAAVAFAVGAEPVMQAATLASTSGVSATVPFIFDRDAFRAEINLAFPHRQVAAPQSFADATVALSHFRNALAAYADPNGFAAGPNSLHCAAVLYGGRSLALALNDAMYAKYPVGLLSDEEMRPKDTSARAYWTALKKNPMNEFYLPLADQGVSLFVCNNALSGYAAEIANRTATPGRPVTRQDVVEIHADLAQNFVRGGVLVPAGVAALIALQEAGFTYLP
jgi:intracellular sulfur oxidation DsrE/DsrF family protein